ARRRRCVRSGPVTHPTLGGALRHPPPAVSVSPQDAQICAHSVPLSADFVPILAPPTCRPGPLRRGTESSSAGSEPPTQRSTGWLGALGGALRRPRSPE